MNKYINNSVMSKQETMMKPLYLIYLILFWSQFYLQEETALSCVLNLILFIFYKEVLISHPFNTHQCVHVNLNLPIHHSKTPTPCHFPPLASISLFSTCVSQFLSCKSVHLYHFPRFHIYALIYDICFSLSDLLHSV